MQPELSGPHHKTYQHIFAHPMPHNLQWRDVWSMLGAIPGAETTEDDKGILKVTRNGQMLTLHRPKTKDFADKKELMQIRHFLDRSGVPELPPAEAGTHVLVVIDHQQSQQNIEFPNDPVTYMIRLCFLQ